MTPERRDARISVAGLVSTEGARRAFATGRVGGSRWLARVGGCGARSTASSDRKRQETKGAQHHLRTMSRSVSVGHRLVCFPSFGRVRRPMTQRLPEAPSACAPKCFGVLSSRRLARAPRPPEREAHGAVTNLKTASAVLGFRLRSERNRNRNVFCARHRACGAVPHPVCSRLSHNRNHRFHAVPSAPCAVRVQAAMIVSRSE